MFEAVVKYLRRKADPIDLLSKLTPHAQLKTLVHVGAHIAQERSHYEANGYQSILWIEGSAEIHQRLVKILAQHQGPAKHLAYHGLLADHDDQEVELRLFSNDGMSSSIYSPTEESLTRWPSVTETGRTEVAVTRTLDTVLRGTEFENGCDTLVVDVQGAELLVLRGAEKTVASAKAIVAEVSTVPYYKGGVMFDELREHLQQRGFVPMSAPRRHGDMLFLRRDLVKAAA
jgi:FkbM family methyltransferase